jgi:hypothetical protein
MVSSSSEAVDEIDLLDWWRLAVWWHGWDCDSPGTLSETQPNWRQHSIHILRWDTANAISCLLDLFYAITHRTMKYWLGRNSLSVQRTAFDLNRAPWAENESHSGSLIMPFRTKGLQLHVCLLQPVSTLSLSRYTLHTKQLVTHKLEELCRKNKLCIIAITTLMPVGSHSLILTFWHGNLNFYHTL